MAPYTEIVKSYRTNLLNDKYVLTFDSDKYRFIKDLGGLVLVGILGFLRIPRHEQHGTLGYLALGMLFAAPSSMSHLTASFRWG